MAINGWCSSEDSMLGSFLLSPCYTMYIFKLNFKIFLLVFWQKLMSGNLPFCQRGIEKWPVIILSFFFPSVVLQFYRYAMYCRVFCFAEPAACGSSGAKDETPTRARTLTYWTTQELYSLSDINSSFLSPEFLRIPPSYADQYLRPLPLG